jgi:hypothetical protein
MNYIYLDSKIYGSVLQLINYFDSNVFDINNTIVYYKKYNVCAKNFKNIFQKNSIKAYPFSQYKEINMQSGSVVFYLFNAQSNCRIVANRDLKHIFITHGESNKVSSIKPIIRIYDYIITAGQMGIDRYVSNNIFYYDDIKRERLIKMGNTFVGRNNYVLGDKDSPILYAPTWEGGVPLENYSSLAWENIFEKIYKYMALCKQATIFIQPHPNLAHRLKIYGKKLYEGIEWLIRQGCVVKIVKPFKNLTDYYLKIKYTKRFDVVCDKQDIYVSEAFCDISAMEAQLLAKKIPVRVFIKKDNNYFCNEILKSHYGKNGIFESEKIKEANVMFDDQTYDYMFGYSKEEIKELPLSKRVDWLVNYIQKIKNVKK